MPQFVEKGVSVSKRDDGSFDEFMRSSSPRLLRLAWLLTGGATSAEDLVQETLERVYVAWPRLDPGGTHNYARRILVNLHTDGHRRRWREDLRSELPERGQADRSDAVALADQLSAALAELPVRERQCVVLRHHADLSEREVADALDVSTGTVKSSTSRGLARLRSLLVTEGERHV